MEIIKELKKKNGNLAIIFGFIAFVVLLPLAIVYIILRYTIEKPINYILNKLNYGKSI